MHSFSFDADMSKRGSLFEKHYSFRSCDDEFACFNRRRNRYKATIDTIWGGGGAAGITQGLLYLLIDPEVSGTSQTSGFIFTQSDDGN